MEKIKSFCILTFLLFLCGCGSKYKEGYIIDKGKQQVIWRTVDMGYGVREKIVKTADIKTFTILNFKIDPYFKPNAFAKDKQYVYCEGDIIKDADPQTFRYEENIYKDDKNVFIFDGMRGFVPESLYNKSRLPKNINSTKKEKYKAAYIEKNGKEIGAFKKKLKLINIGDNYNQIIKILGTPVIDRKESSTNSNKRVLYYFLRKEKKNSIHEQRDYYFRLTLDNSDKLIDIFEKLPVAPRFLDSSM